jgi:hypothetical protein
MICTSYQIQIGRDFHQKFAGKLRKKGTKLGQKKFSFWMMMPSISVVGFKGETKIWDRAKEMIVLKI